MSSSNDDDDKLMHSVLEGDADADAGKLIEEAVNQGMGAFIPDMMLSQMVNSFKQAKQMFGERILREVTGYSSDFIEKNVKVPEFQRDLKSRIGDKIKDLKNKNLIDEDGNISHKGYKLSALVMYTEELDHLDAKGLMGNKDVRDISRYGEKEDSWPYKVGDRYADIDIRKTIKKSIKRGHMEVLPDDLKIHERKAKGNIEIIYAIDASGSMKGKKIEMSKKSGIALAYKAIENKDKVGIIVFGSEVKEKLAPTLDFMSILESLSKISASKETNFAETIKEAIKLFSSDKQVTKHLIFITDGMPTVGDNPQKLAYDAISVAQNSGILCSMIGVGIDGEAIEFLKKAAEIGDGKFHHVKDVENLDIIILEDYNSM